MAPERSERSEVFRSASILGLLTVASRVLGMVRDVICAALFPLPVWDAFVIAWTVPNLFRRLFGEGALASTFIPVYTETLETEGAEPARTFASSLFGTLLVLLLTLTAAGVAVALVLPLAGGAGSEKLTLTAHLSALLMPYLLLVCTTALMASVLNAHRRFALAALAPVLLNVFWIGGAVVAWACFQGEDRIFVMASVILAGGAAQVVLLLAPLMATGLLGAPRVSPGHPGVRTVGRLALPVIFGLAILQVNVLFDRLIAEFCVAGDGAVSALYFGNRLMQLPLGVIGIAAATAVFPSLAAFGARQDMDGFRRIVGQSLVGTFFLALPAAAGLMVLSGPVVELLFGHGAFAAATGGEGPTAVARTALVVVLYGAGLPAYCGIHVVTRGFYAVKDTATPVKIAAACVAVNLALNLALVWPLAEAGLALATAATAWLNFALCLIFLGRRVETSWTGQLLSGNARALVAACLSAGAAFGLHRALASGLGTEGKVPEAIAVVGAVAAGGGVYAILSALLGDPSLKLWTARVLKRDKEG